MTKKTQKQAPVVCPLNKLLAGAADYRDYKLVTSKGTYHDLSAHWPCFRKRNDVQMQFDVFSGSG